MTGPILGCGAILLFFLSGIVSWGPHTSLNTRFVVFACLFGIASVVVTLVDRRRERRRRGAR